MAPGPSVKKVRYEATKTAVQSPEMAQYQYVHLATHGILDKARSKSPMLVFSLVDEAGNL